MDPADNAEAEPAGSQAHLHRRQASGRQEAKGLQPSPVRPLGNADQWQRGHLPPAQRRACVPLSTTRVKQWKSSFCYFWRITNTCIAGLFQTSEANNSQHWLIWFGFSAGRGMLWGHALFASKSFHQNKWIHFLETKCGKNATIWFSALHKMCKHSAVSS